MLPSALFPISKWWLRSITLLLATTPPVAVLWFQDTLVPYIATLSPLVLLRVISVLLLSTTALMAFVILQRPWLRWDESTGTWVNRFTSLRYCPKCRAAKIITPLKNEATGWRCMNCMRFFSDPTVAQIESPKKKTTRSERI